MFKDKTMKRFTYKLARDVGKSFDPGFPYRIEKGLLTVESGMERAEVTDRLIAAGAVLAPETVKLEAKVDCANCADKIERALKDHPLVEDARFFFSRNLLTVTGYMDREEIKDVARKADGDVVFPQKAEKHVFKVSVDCAGCAQKVEKALQASTGVESARFDFQRGRLTVVSTLSPGQIRKIARDCEEDIVFSSGLDGDSRKADPTIFRLAAALLLLVAAGLLKSPYPAVAAYLVSGADVLYKAVRNILRGKVFDENFLMGIATVGALLISSYSEAAGVMIFYQIGEYFQRKAVGRSRSRIGKLMDMTEETVTLLRNGKWIEARPEEALVGDTMLIRGGERIALDCVVTEGCSYLDQRALTGESVPVKASSGCRIMSGSMNGEGVLTARVEKTYADSTATKIRNLMDSADVKKASSERFITRFSRIYTPFVCILALLIASAVPLLTPYGVEVGIYRALSLLVISCPCALVLSIPLTYFASVGSFARNQILVKDAGGIERLSHVRTVAFDKTGTLTKGNFNVVRVKAADGDDEKLVLIAASLESKSSHPVAKSIMEFPRKGELMEASDVREIPGVGIEGTIGGDRYRIGRTGCTEKIDDGDFGTVCHVEKNGRCMGYIVISDEIKEESASAIASLKEMGVERTVMLSGDNERVAGHVARRLGIDEVHAELMPAEKLVQLDRLIEQGGPVCYAGDGMNDAPALARADIGIAMGGVGSDAAIEAADMVVMNDGLDRIAKAVRISRKTQRIVKENIVLSIGIKLVVMALSVAGMANMWMAVFADTGVCIIAVLNAMRAMGSARSD